MSLLSALFRASPEDPTNPILSSDPSLLSLFNTETFSGEVVNERTAFGLIAYYRAVALISGALAGLPLHRYTNGTRERVNTRTVLSSPNPRHKVPMLFWQTMFVNGLTWGNMYALKERDGAGLVKELWPVHPSLVRTIEVPRTSANTEGIVHLVRQTDGTEKRYKSWDMFHVPYVAPNGVSGLRPLEIASQALGTGMAAEKSAGKFFNNGSMVGGVLTTDADLTQLQADALQARWAEKTSGAANSGRVAVLDNGASFQPISIPPKDAELLASRKWTVTEIARMFGLPPHMLGDVEKTTSWGTGIEQQMTGFAIFTLKPWLQLTEQLVTAEILPGGVNGGTTYAEYAIDGLLRGDSVARAQVHASGIQWGWLNRNEARGHENLPPVDGLDEYLTPLNMAVGTDDLLADTTDVDKPEGETNDNDS